MTELEPKLNYPFPSGDYVTLGGLIHHRLGRIAAVGDVLLLEGARLEVLEMDNHRITKVLFEYQVSEEPEDAETAIEEGKAGRSVVNWSSRNILKKVEDQAEIQANGADRKSDERVVTDTTKEAIPLNKISGS